METLFLLGLGAAICFYVLNPSVFQKHKDALASMLSSPKK